MNTKYTPLVSVVMSVYNGEDYLAAAIESILEQTYVNIEFVIVNDGSSDSSLSIIKKYMKIDDRIVLIDQDNIGLTRSLNKAISYSKGKYIARQDADDESLSSRLAVQMSYIKEYNLDLVTSRAIKNTKSVPNPFMLNFRKVDSFKAGNMFIHGTFFGKTSIFKKIGYNEQFTYAQDFKFILECIKHKVSIGYVAEPLYIINDVESNISNRKKKEQNQCVSQSLIEHFGTDRCFKLLSRFNGFPFKIIKILALISFNFGGDDAFKYIKK
ncbi:glycosyltransferase [Vibrio sp. DW001]|uniref:glycosyltransferase family 2 protein n=1 Tax=Vibrio sp. DW001 TaxID=2912315 RepID=UPI0023B06E8D|nr:glycosyltransferase [Vibrio sp. DW001]WED26882.1 glycosyltransferase [Vibrio sp. DW001]